MPAITMGMLCSVPRKLSATAEVTRTISNSATVKTTIPKAQPKTWGMSWGSTLRGSLMKSLGGSLGSGPKSGGRAGRRCVFLNRRSRIWTKHRHLRRVRSEDRPMFCFEMLAWGLIWMGPGIGLVLHSCCAGTTPLLLWR